MCEHFDGFKCMKMDQRREWAFYVSVRLGGMNLLNYGMEWIQINAKLYAFKCMKI